MDIKDYECMICIQEMDLDNTLSIKCCTKMFCKGCITKSLIAKKECPACRTKTEVSDLFKNFSLIQMMKTYKPSGSDTASEAASDSSK